MNKQEIFDKVASHLLKQNEQSIMNDDSSTCAYRGKNNSMCAIGCLIDDKYYDESLEGKSVAFYKVFNALKLSGIEIESRFDTLFLSQLQNIHDSFLPIRWKNELFYLANTYELEWKF